MGQRVYVKVVGFDDAERHALNTLLRLSAGRETSYALWVAESGLPAQLLLVDSDSYEAQLEFASPSNDGLPIVWIGAGTPRRASRCFRRPVQWPAVIAAMDELLHQPPALELDLDLAAPLEPPPKRALVASADLSHRLYLRARLALAGITQVDDAVNGSQALELVRTTAYAVALLDFGLPGVSGWELLRQVGEARPRIPHVIVSKERLSAFERLRAWWRGHETLLRHPPHPGKLSLLLAKV